MKSPTSSRPAVLMLIGALISVAVVAFGFQALAAQPALAAPTITSKPANPAASTSATFAFTGPSGVTFQCLLDTAAFASCTSPKSYTGLSQGSHTFKVRSVSGSKQSEPTSYTWTVDTLTPAAPTITSMPANPAASTSATFAFTGPSGATFQCLLDAAAFATCTSPRSYTGLAQGSHTFKVRSVSGTRQSQPTSYTWTVDTVPPPVPTITANPALLSNTTSPSFSFSDTESGVSFRCQLDGSAFTACSSPRDYSGLSQGLHTFRVVAVDAAGNTSGPATWSWTIDSLAPSAPVLTTKAPDPTSNATNTFAWSLSETGLTFQCSVENGDWFACSTPYTWVIDTDNYGQHQFAVRAIDAAGNISAGTYYQFKYEKGLPESGLPFTITGSVSGLTLGTYKPILVTITNPNNVIIYVSALNVTVAANSTPTGCLSADNVDLLQSNVSTSLMVAVPANGSVNLPAQGAIAPQIRLKNLPTVNQDVCKNKNFALTYSGTATN